MKDDGFRAYVVSPSPLPLTDFVCFDVCVYLILLFFGWERRDVVTIYCVLCFCFCFCQGVLLSTSHLLVFVLFGFWFYLHKYEHLSD